MRESKRGYLIDGDDLAGVIEALRPDFRVRTVVHSLVTLVDTKN